MTRRPSAKKKRQRSTDINQLRGGSGVLSHSRTPEEPRRDICQDGKRQNCSHGARSPPCLLDASAADRGATVMWPRYSYSNGSRRAFYKYNVLSWRELYSLALLPRSAFSLWHWVHLGRTRLNRPSSATRWSTFGTKPYSTISSMRSRFSCLPFPARPNAAPHGCFPLGFFSSAGVCMRWH